MTRTGLPGMVRKEAHALWLVWAGTAAACLAVAVAGQPQFITPGRLAYFVGSVALAALSVGHEYTHGTLPLLLSLPVDRRRLLVGKLLALAPMLGTLALLALTTGLGGPYFERGRIVVGLSVLAAVTVAPWLTMLCRSPLAGAVFALGIAGFMQVASLGMVLAWLKLGGSAAMGLEALHDLVLTAGLLIVSMVGIVFGRRKFLRLEVIDGRDTPVSWPRFLRSAMALDQAELVAPARRSNPYGLLLKKEIRIQQMSIAVAGINVVSWLSTYAIVGPSPAAEDVMAAIAILYGGLLAILIGALASAEERHLGTLAWQTLLPVAAWRQFAVKTAVALSLSLLLAFALPILLARGDLAVNPVHAAAVLLLTIGSLFVSSRCDSGLTAMAWAAPTLFVVVVMLGWSFGTTAVNRDAAVAVIGALAALAWRSAFVNHRTAR